MFFQQIDLISPWNIFKRAWFENDTIAYIYINVVRAQQLLSMNRSYGFLSSTHTLRYLVNNATLGRIEYGIIKINLYIVI